MLSAGAAIVSSAAARLARPRLAWSSMITPRQQLREDDIDGRVLFGEEGGHGLDVGGGQAVRRRRRGPTLVAVHLNLGDAYRANRKWQDAKRELDQALRMQDPLPEPVARFVVGQRPEPREPKLTVEVVGNHRAEVGVDGAGEFLEALAWLRSG